MDDTPFTASQLQRQSPAVYSGISANIQATGVRCLDKYRSYSTEENFINKKKMTIFLAWCEFVLTWVNTIL